MQKPTVLIADDHTMIVDAFRKLLEPYYEIIASVSDGRALLEKAPELKPDVIVVDIGMPCLNGLAAAANHPLRDPAEQRVARIEPEPLHQLGDGSQAWQPGRRVRDHETDRPRYRCGPGGCRTQDGNVRLGRTRAPPLTASSSSSRLLDDVLEPGSGDAGGPDEQRTRGLWHS